MDIKAIIKSQYHAALEMLHHAIIQCSDNLWRDERFENKFWHIAYHACFYTHLYIHVSESAFIPWEKERTNYNFMGPLPWPPYSKPEIDERYTKAEILEYLDLLRSQIDERVDELNLEGESGFSWIPLSKMELQFYNIRHIQVHTGELSERLNAESEGGVEWIGAKLDNDK